MHFCSQCDNMYYIRISAENSNQLVYYCRNCGHEDTMLTVDNLTITSSSVNTTDTKITHINKYTKMDPTLPRIKDILCPNAECETNVKHTEREIICIRYDDINMKYIYLCSTCDTVWKIDDVK
uniref:DNA-directed RNA polymerase M/15kDa subunit domain-containing protein n=1 Tax=viral metagenome TaxID=1070528 RepID=A0A6C0E313_9ZZZZ